MVERMTMDRPPIYMRVPPGHAKNWKRHCREYNACGERVLFVQDNWYNREYVPRYQKRQAERRDDHRDNRNDDRRNDQRGNDRNNHPAQGRDHGRNR